MKLVWKLLRQHISVPQFVGFFFASMLGMFIILLGYQFYRDVLPVFKSEDSFMKADYLVISKKISTNTTISGGENEFTNNDIENLSKQTFIQRVGKFTSANYKVDVALGMNGNHIFNSEFFLESIPDSFVTTPKTQWTYTEGSKIVPMILPKSYLAMYNFGYARNHALPRISEGVIGMLDVDMYVHGKAHNKTFRGKVIGFSNQLNTILVPEKFMLWSNKYFSTDNDNATTRLIIDTNNPTDAALTQYLQEQGYEIENNNLSAEKAAFFLRLVVCIVMIIGVIISALSFYLLMLSIYLLVQKNTTKLQNLMLIGYSPNRVARPYQLLTFVLHIFVLLITIVILLIVRPYYMDTLFILLPTLDEGSILPTCALGIVLLVLISMVNSMVIRRKMYRIWKNKV